MKLSRSISLIPTFSLVVLLFSLLGLLNAQVISPSPTGSWKLTGVMSQARTGAAAAALNSGNMLVTGGTDQSGVVSASAEIYGPTGTFTVVAPMHVARTGHTATWLANPNGSGGFVLVTGGTSGSGAVLGSAELYDPLANAWTLLPALMSADNTGEPATPLPNSSVLLSGGSNSYSVLTGMESFSLVSQGFTPVGSMTTARKNHAAAALHSGSVLIVGGMDASGNTLATTAIYDPVAGTVSAGPSLTTPRAFATATTLLDGTVLIAGGSYPEGAAANGNIAELNTAEIYNPATNTIAPASTKLAQARAGQQAFLLPNNNNVLLVGGTYNGATLASSELYTPWLSQFAATGSLSLPRSSASGAALFPLADGQLLVAGGTNQQPDVSPTVANSAELYGFATLETNATDYAPGTAVLVSGTGWKPGEPVTITLNEIPQVEPTPILTTTADASGNINDGNYAPNKLDLGIRYYALAVGGTSGLQVENTFTDSYYAGNGVTFGVSPVATGNSLGVVDLTHPTGTDAFAPASCSAASCAQTAPTNFDSNLGDTLQFTATAGAGYKFSSWSATYNGGTNPTSNTCTTGSTTNPCSFVVPMGTTLSATVTADYTAIATKLALTSTAISATAGVCSGPVTVTSENSSGTATSPSSTETIALTSTDAMTFYTASGCATSTTSVSIGTSATAVSFYFKDNTAGAPTITATGSGAFASVVTKGETVTATTASKLAFNVQPSNTVAGAAIAPAVTVQVQDTYGNVVTTNTANVTIAIGTNPGAGTLSGTTTVAAVTGVATFSNLSINKSGVGYTLSAAQGALMGTTSSSFNITSGIASKLTFNVQPSNTVAGAAIAPAVTVQVQDTYGNVVTTNTSNVTIAIGTNPGAGTLSGTTTVAAVAGVATFSNLSINKSGVGYTLSAAQGALTGATSSSFNISAGAAAQLAFNVQPSTSTVGYPIAPAVTVQVQDAYGNAVIGDSSTVTLAMNGGTLGGTTTIPASAGVATFGALIPMTAGNYTLSASDAALSGATSLSFTVNQAATDTTVTSGSSPSTYGNSVTFTATVSLQAFGGSGTPTGTVTFSDNGNLLGTQPLAGNIATYLTSSLGAGPHNIRAVYNGDSNFTGSASLLYSQVVNPAVLTVTAVSETSTYGLTLPPLDYTMTGFVLGESQATAVTGAPAEAYVVTGTPTPGPYQISISQGTLAAANYSFSFVPGGLLVNQATSTATVTALTSSIYSNQTTQVTVTIPASGYGVVPTGTVTLFLNGSGTPQGPAMTLTQVDATDAAATWSLSGSQFAMGANSITVAYSGDSNYIPSNSLPFTETLLSNQVSSGSSNVGAPAPIQTLTYSFTSNTTLSGVNILTGGISGLDYTDGGSSTCVVGQTYTAGQTCTVTVAFTPSAPGLRAGGVTLFAQGSTLPLQTWFLDGVGQASAVAIDPGTQTTIATLANSGTAGGSAVDAAGNVYVVDRANSQVIKLAAGTFSPTTIVASGLLNPTAVALDGAGNLYISDTGNSRVAMVPNELGTLNVADLSTVTITGLGSPRGIAVDGNGYLYVVDSTNGNVIQVPGSGGAQVNVASGLTSPHGVAVDAAGNVYVSSTSGVFEYPFVAGTPSTYGAAVAYGSGFGNPRSIAVDASGTVYVADNGNSQIVVVMPGGASQANLALTGITSPQGVAVDASANLYISVGGSVIQANRTLAAPLSFASINIGSTSASQALTVTDVGNQQLTLSGLAVTANFTQTTSGGTDCSSTTTLGAAGQCLIATAFAPTASGPLPGTVTLNDNALNLASTQTVQLSGTGLLDPQNITFTLTLGSVTFGDGPFTLTATADSSLPVSYQVTGPGYINGVNQLVITGAGTVTVVATQIGDGVLWAPAAPVSRSISIAPANQSTLTVTGMPGTAQPYGTSFTVGASGGSGTGALTFVASGACSNNGSTVTMISGIGICSVTAAMAADSNYNSTTSAALTVAAAKATLTVTASSSSVTYGSAVPTITASYSGFVSPDNVSLLTALPVCTTVYTTTTAVGTLPSTSCSGATAANYAFTYVNGSVTISQEQTSTTLQATAATVMSKSGVTFTAKVSGSTAIPSGSVNFLDGSSTIGTGTLDNTGAASLTISSLAVGSHSITAVYAASVNFGGSASPAVSEAVQDFNFTVSGATTTVLSATVAKGGAAVYTLQIAPTSGSTFAAAVTLTLTGLPTGATYTISPSATIAVGSAVTTVTVTVNTSTQVSLAAPSQKEGGAFPKALVLAIFLPLLATRRLRSAVRAHMKASVLMMLMLTVLTVGGMTACGGHSSQPAAQSYAMTLTGTSGALQHTVTLNLTVQ